MTDRTAVLLLTHQWNQFVRAKLERLRREIGAAAEVFALLQKSPETTQAIRGYPDERGAAFLFDPEILPKLLGFPFFRGTSIVPGSTHYPVLAFARAKPDYGHYLVIEHDVDFSGSWRELVEEVIAAAPDFASSHLRGFEQDPDWHWWPSLQPPAGDPAWERDQRDLRGSFNPLYCISRQGLELLDAAHRRGWSGHYEVLVATILSHSGCRVVDLAEVGGFYVAGPPNAPRGTPREALSTMRWRPSVLPQEFLERSTGRTLFHPIKAPWFYNGEQLVGIARPAQPKAQE